MIDLKAIEEAARGATPGPWRHNKDNEQIGDVCQPDGWTVATTQPQPIPKQQQHIQRDRDAIHISLCDPQTVLKLVEIARAAKELERVLGHYGTFPPGVVPPLQSLRAALKDVGL